jgi:hypothetical protein
MAQEMLELHRVFDWHLSSVLTVLFVAVLVCQVEWSLAQLRDLRQLSSNE